MRKTLATSLALGIAFTSHALSDPLSDKLSALLSGQSLAAEQVQSHQRKVGRKHFDVPPVRARAMRASFYGGGPRKYEPNSHTANGERFNQWAMTAAHRTLPFGTRLHVCYRGCVVVRINDRGPAAWTGRSLDLSRGAATVIGLVGPGTGLVRVAQLD